VNKNKTIGTGFTSNVHIAADSIAAWMPLALAVSMFLINMTSQHGDYDLRRANFDTNAIFSESPLMAVVLGTALGIEGAAQLFQRNGAIAEPRKARRFIFAEAK